MFPPTHDDSLDVYQLTLYSFLLLSTLYSWAWDVLQDWALLEPGTGWALRSRRMFKDASVYKNAAFLDFVMRLFWMTTLIPDSEKDDYSSLQSAFYAYRACSLFGATVEIFRRTMWSMIRLENEHLNNTSEYRKMTYIPLHFSMHNRKQAKPEIRKVGERRWLFVEVSVFLTVVAVLIMIPVLLAKNDGDKK